MSTPLATFACGELILGFSPTSGALVLIRWQDQTLLQAAATAGPAITLEMDGKKHVPAGLVHLTRAPLADGMRITLAHTFTDLPDIAVHETWDILADPLRIERRATVQRAADAPDRRALQRATLRLTGLTAGDPAQTRISAPMTRMAPDIPLAEALRRTPDLDIHPQPGQYDCQLSAPDTFVGALTAAHATRPLHVTVLPLPNQASAKLRFFGQDQFLVVEYDFICETWLLGGTCVEIGAQAIFPQARTWSAALPVVGQYLAKHGYAPPEDRPSWAGNLAIYEVEIEHLGGLRQVTAQLPRIQDAGFDTIYLMPWHQGGYGTLDYAQVNPRLGTADDLTHLCAAAHARGMRVLFDLLVNIAGANSPYIAAHPDWFYHDDAGQPLKHPMWGGCCLDPAAPSFRRYFIDYAVRCVRDWGADGFRVDAVAHRGGNWRNLPGLEPHQHSYAIFTLMREVRRAIRAIKPEAICMAECFGPAQAPVSDVVCWQWIAFLDWCNDALVNQRLTGRQLQHILGQHLLIMPPKVWFTGYTHTHDTIAFENREIDGPAIEALLALLALTCAGTMIFAGGWKMRNRPNETELPRLQELFAFRRTLGRVAGSDLQFPAATAFPDPRLCAVIRPSPHGPVTILANFSPEAVALPTDLRPNFSRLHSPAGTILPYDVLAATPA